jgi:hypothetical protein
MNFSWLHVLLAEKANDQPLRVTVQHLENSEENPFSVKMLRYKDTELEREAFLPKMEYRAAD